MLTVETHSHTHHSKDCLMRFDTIAALCAMRGIDRLIVTDHNTADGALAFQQAYPGLVIVGEEVMTSQGELLAFFVTHTVPPGHSPEATIGALRAQGAFISVSHPFDRLRKGAWNAHELARIAPLVDAIEGFNARCVFPQDNARAQAFAKRVGLPTTVGSDAHTPGEYGRALLRLPAFHDATSFAQALAHAQPIVRLSPPWVHLGSSAAKWTRKLGWVAQPRRA